MFLKEDGIDLHVELELPENGEKSTLWFWCSTALRDIWRSDTF